MSQLRSWQRRHGRVVAEVSPVPGMGTWEACARLLDPPETQREVGLQFSLLTDAQDAADVLARSMVDTNAAAGASSGSRSNGARFPDELGLHTIASPSAVTFASPR